MLSYLIADIETRKRVLGKDEAPREGEGYAKSWGDRTDMSISVLCTMDALSYESRVFFLEDLAEFAALASSYDYLVGYNNKSFDDQMLKAHGYPCEEITRYDIMHEIRPGNPDGHKSMKLDTVLELNSLPTKKYSGADAPYLWQSGQIGKLVTYCLEDVRLTTFLFQRILAGTPINTTIDTSFVCRHPSLVC